MIRRAKLYPVSISSYAERHSAFWFYSGWKEMYNPGLRGYEIADQVFPYVEKWLKDNEQRDNWFLHVNFWDPHTPYRTPMDFGNPFENDPAPSWITQDIIDSQRKSYGPHSACEPSGFTNQNPPRWLPRLKRLKEIRNLDDFKTWIDGYDVGIRYTDEFIGKITRMLKDFGIYDDTIIILSSDHGENQGELNIYGDHATACHITNRVPMIIRWPENNWKKEVDSLIYQVDIASTLIDSFKLEIPDFWDGFSLKSNLDNDNNVGRDFLVISQNAWSCQRTIRFDNWTLIKTYHTGLKNFPEIMLFDYEKDFHMTKNLATEELETVEMGLKHLETWYNEMLGDQPDIEDPMDIVLREGGPFHTRGQMKGYIRRLEKSGREEMVKTIQNRNELYSL
jgi:arylsulfatase A-like enzyme